MCVVLADGGVMCWGDNSAGQLGIGDTNDRGDDEIEFPLVNLGAGRTASIVTAGSYFFSGSHTCALLDDGSIKCWGRNAAGQLGLGNTNVVGDDESDLQTVNLGLGRTAESVTAGGSHVCARLDNGVKCWGENGAGQLGVGDTDNRGDNSEEMGDFLPYVQLQ